jgi:hypothetical protein
MKSQENIGGGNGSKAHSPLSHSPEMRERSTRGSVSNENNILLDPEVLTDYPTQALLLTVLVSSSTSNLLPSVLIELFSLIGYPREKHN